MLILKQGEWNGLVGDLVRRSADLAACGLTRTYERSLAVDFSVGLVQDPMTLIGGTPTGESVNFTAYLGIFRDTVWVVIFVLAAALALSMLLISGLLIDERFHGDAEKFSLMNATAVVLLSLGQMNYVLKRTRYASKTLFVFGSVFAFLIFAYYNAVLTSLMTSAPPSVKITSFSDVIEADLKVL